ncbi:hypothetical protein O1L60_44475, partial [Streptomyces diastatochromogenes]|nr:hypothetical protein [Streptomyces diastatochromogenes]
VVGVFVVFAFIVKRFRVFVRRFTARSGINSASRILKAGQFAQARIVGTRASAVAWAGSEGRCITRGPV